MLSKSPARFLLWVLLTSALFIHLRGDGEQNKIDVHPHESPTAPSNSGQNHPHKSPTAPSNSGQNHPYDPTLSSSRALNPGVVVRCGREVAYAKCVPRGRSERAP